MSYFKRGIDSFNLLRKNLNLFIPDLIYIFIFLLLALIFLKLTGLLNNINNFYDAEALKTQFQELFKNISFLVKFLIFLLIFILINFIIGTRLLVIKLDMINKLVKTKKTSFKESLMNSKNYFLSLILMKILIYLIITLPLLIIIFIQVLLKQQILTFALLAFLLVFYIYLLFALMFIYPVMYLKTKKPVNIIKESALYFSNNKKHVFYTFLTIFVITILASYLLMPLQELFSLAPEVLVILFSIIFYILNFIVNKTLSLWRIIFIFINYHKKD